MNGGYTEDEAERSWRSRGMTSGEFDALVAQKE